jgi:hypothetical protein
MIFLIIKTSNLINAVIIAASLFISGFLFLFGIANLINPDVPQEFLLQNTIVCIVVCCIGVAFLLLAIASLRGILYKT